MSKRQQKNDDMVDRLMKHDLMNDIIEKHKDELLDFTYIKTVEEFSVLEIKGVIRYINKYDKILRYGGLCIKIYEKGDDWIGVILKYNKKYYVSFKNNYIFYLDSKDKLIRNYLDVFVTDFDKGLYEVE